MVEETIQEERATYSVGVLGARGYVGAELIRLIYAHPQLRLLFASSRQLAGEPIGDLVSTAPPNDRFVNLGVSDLAARPADVYFLALPNGLAADYVAAFEEAGYGDSLMIDLSADYRFDDDWIYGLPEHDKEGKLKSATRIANPGCYATAVQLAIRPLVDELAGSPCAFGVSGYSGAGTTPNPRNDPEQLRDNLLPYALTDHIHEREISRHLDCAVRFAPHVGAFFRGISITSMLALREAKSLAEINATYESFYADCPFVKVDSETIPQLRDNVGQYCGCVGGFTVSHEDPSRLVVVSTIDNLLKGAASQAIQNLNLALGMAESEGLT